MITITLVDNRNWPPLTQENIQTGFIELGHIGLGKLYEVFKNWGVDVTADFKVGKAEQMFHMDKQVEVKTIYCK